MRPLRVTIWNEYLHELQHDAVRAIYPEGIHGALRRIVEERCEGATVRTATLRERDHGLSDELLAQTDVMFWWGHKAHAEVSDGWAAKVHGAVLSGMGFVALHSAHFAKPFKRLMGTNCSLRWREADEKERMWNLAPAHPIMAGVPDHFELAQEEMYGERFDVPEPDELLMLSWFQGGDVFRSLCTWRRGHGRVVYFRPGHETYPSYHDANVRTIVANAAGWARRRITRPGEVAPRVEALEHVPNPGKEHI
jgi:trehalose utilization protein